MINPARVTGFLDIAGAWDPTLMFVLGGAVGVTTLAFRIVLRRKTPLCEPQFSIPTRSRADRHLIVGAAIFGIGWGVTGYCPGPGLSGLTLGSTNALLFVVAFVAGLLLTNRLVRAPLPEQKDEDG